MHVVCSALGDVKKRCANKQRLCKRASVRHAASDYHLQRALLHRLPQLQRRDGPSLAAA
jgi:hypothetical protein